MVPFAKNTTHPHPHQPPNDEIRLINTSIPKYSGPEIAHQCNLSPIENQQVELEILKL